MSPEAVGPTRVDAAVSVAAKHSFTNLAFFLLPWTYFCALVFMNANGLLLVVSGGALHRWSTYQVKSRSNYAFLVSFLQRTIINLIIYRFNTMAQLIIASIDWQVSDALCPLKQLATN